MLATQADQHGDDDEGIFGFLEEDIRRIIRLCKTKQCYICDGRSAAIKCRYYRKCKRSFHFACGYRNGCLSTFLGRFYSYCHEHVPNHLIDPIEDDVPCMICIEYIEETQPLMRVPSCCSDVMFHRRCMAQTAFFSGYLTKCSKCHRTTDEYKNMLRERGVFVPDRDAAWEAAPEGADAYPDLLFRPNHCTAVKCKRECICKCIGTCLNMCRCACERGCAIERPNARDHVVKGGVDEWNVLSCVICGGKGAHRRCTDGPQFFCDLCDGSRAIMECTLAQMPTNIENEHQCDDAHSSDDRIHQPQTTASLEENDEAMSDDGQSPDAYTTENSADEDEIWPDVHIDLSDSSSNECEEVPLAINDDIINIDDENTDDEDRETHERMNDKQITTNATDIHMGDISAGEIVNKIDESIKRPIFEIVGVRTASPTSLKGIKKDCFFMSQWNLSAGPIIVLDEDNFASHMRETVNCNRQPARAARKTALERSDHINLISDEE